MDSSIIPTRELSQCEQLAEALIQKGEVNTLYARDELGVMNPAQRISEMIKRAMPIAKDWVNALDKKGNLRRVRNYIWQGENAKQQDLWGYECTL